MEFTGHFKLKIVEPQKNLFARLQPSLYKKPVRVVVHTRSQHHFIGLCREHQDAFLPWKYGKDHPHGYFSVLDRIIVFQRSNIIYDKSGKLRNQIPIWPLPCKWEGQIWLGFLPGRAPFFSVLVVEVPDLKGKVCHQSVIVRLVYLKFNGPGIYPITVFPVIVP